MFSELRGFTSRNHLNVFMSVHGDGEELCGYQWLSVEKHAS